MYVIAYYLSLSSSFSVLCELYSEYSASFIVRHIYGLRTSSLSITFSVLVDYGSLLSRGLQLLMATGLFGV